MKINAGEIRVGMLLEHKNDLWQVLKTQHVKPGKGGAFAQVEMKSVNKNTKLNERFRSSETVEKASLDEINFNNYKKLLLNNANLLAISSYVWNNKKYKPFESIKKLNENKCWRNKSRNAFRIQK